MRISLFAASLALATMSCAATAAESMRFAFGTETTGPGWLRVGPDTRYGVGQPYGIHPGARPGPSPFFFSVDLPEGNYRVSVRVGDPAAEAITTIKAEARRLMVKEHHTPPGMTQSLVFCVNLRTPALPGGDRVRLNDRERDHSNWDQRLTLEFTDQHPCISTVEIAPAPDAVTLYLAGDSTVTDQKLEPWCAWGQMLPQFFSPSLAVANHAESGRTLDSFRDQHRLEKILQTLRAGDYLFIQFGHNDMKQKEAGQGPFLNFKDNLRTYIAAARAHDAIPVLLTPMHRRQFDGDGHIIDTFGDYPVAIRQVAKELDVALIDLHRESRLLFEALGKEGSRKAFVHYPAHTFPGQDEALKDDSHFSPYGADLLARCVVEGIRTHLPELARHVRSDLPVFHPASPHPFQTWHLPTSPLLELTPPEGN
jgi:lysophospholipase L1-like esterase